MFDIQFDHSILENANKFKINQEVDALDPNKCWIRGKVTGVQREFVSIEFESSQITLHKDRVFRCGEKIPSKRCGRSDSAIRIKFCKGGADLDVCKKILTEFTFFDTGEILGDKLSKGALS